jgi:chromosome segregation ATPase
VSDDLSFPLLAGSALTQAFGFLYGRLAALLDRRAGRVEADHVDADGLSPLLANQLAPLQVDEEALTQHAQQLQSLSEVLRVYRDHPELLDGQDERLRRNLARLREALEAVYGQCLTFRDEQRQRSALSIQQRVEEVSGEMVGLDADEVAGPAHAEITQASQTAKSGSKIVGARVKRFG